MQWVTSLRDVTEGGILAVNGKTLRGSYSTGDGRAAIHVVSVWASANHLSLGSTVVDEKSNEITAIPRLLELVEISGGLVTIDAMGCQKEIARTIVDQGAPGTISGRSSWKDRSAGRKTKLASGNYFLEPIENQTSENC